MSCRIICLRSTPNSTVHLGFDLKLQQKVLLSFLVHYNGLKHIKKVRQKSEVGFLGLPVTRDVIGEEKNVVVENRNVNTLPGSKCHVD